jgi:hypothetical protein
VVQGGGGGLLTLSSNLFALCWFVLCRLGRRKELVHCSH